MRHAVCGKLLQPCLQRIRALYHRQPVGQPDSACHLRGQKPHQVAVAHRRQRMILHRAFGQRLLADEQVAHEDRAAIFRKGRAVDSLRGPEVIHQRLGHRADIALIRAVEGRAVFPEEALGTGGAKPGQRGATIGHRLIHRGCAAFQGDHLERGGV